MKQEQRYQYRQQESHTERDALKRPSNGHTMDCWIAPIDMNNNTGKISSNNRHNRHQSRNRNRRPSPVICKHALLPLLLLCLQLQLRPSTSTSIVASTNRNTKLISNYMHGRDHDHDQNTRIIYTPVVAAILSKDSGNSNNASNINSNNSRNGRSNDTYNNYKSNKSRRGTEGSIHHRRRRRRTNVDSNTEDKTISKPSDDNSPVISITSSSSAHNNNDVDYNTVNHSDKQSRNSDINRIKVGNTSHISRKDGGMGDDGTVKVKISSKRGRKKMIKKRKLLNAGVNGINEFEHNKKFTNKPPKENKPPREAGNGKAPGGKNGKEFGNGKPGGGEDENKGGNKGKDFGNEKPGGGGPGGGGGGDGGGGGGKNNNKKTTSPSPTVRPSEYPSPVPSPRPTPNPTYHPTTSPPTIEKGNPTPSPTFWVNSWVKEDIVLSLSTMTADEDQLEFLTDVEADASPTTNTNASLGGTRRKRDLSLSQNGSSNLEGGKLSRGERLLERIYASDVLSGNQGDLVELIFTSVADTLCKYTDFVILSLVTASSDNVDPSLNEYTDYCKKDGVIIDTNSYYSNRATVIVAPVSATNDLSQVDANEFQVFEGSIVGNYLHWIQWDIKCPIVQISRTILNEENQDLDSALVRVQAKARLVMDTVTTTNEMNEILSSKDEDILSVSASGWEVLKSIEFMKPRKENRKDTGNKQDDVDYLEGNTGDNQTPDRYKIFQPLRIAGLTMMAFIMVLVTGLIKAGKRRDDKAWEARMLATSPMNGDLVSYEGVNFLLQNSRIEAENLQVSPPLKGGQSSNSMSMKDDREYKDYQENESKQARPERPCLTSESDQNSGFFREDLNTGFEEVITIQKKTSILRKNKSSVTHLCVSPTEIEVAASPSSKEFPIQGNSFFPSSPMNTNELKNPNSVRNTNRASDKAKKLKNSHVKHTVEEPILASNAASADRRSLSPSFTSWIRS